MEEDENDIILVNDFLGKEFFNGTREEFRDLFFSDASNDEINDWCFCYGHSLIINKEKQIV
jgi:hypothetical protein